MVSPKYHAVRFDVTAFGALTAILINLSIASSRARRYCIADISNIQPTISLLCNTVPSIMLFQIVSLHLRSITFLFLVSAKQAG